MDRLLCYVQHTLNLHTTEGCWTVHVCSFSQVTFNVCSEVHMISTLHFEKSSPHTDFNNEHIHMKMHKCAYKAISEQPDEQGEVIFFPQG